MIDKVLIAEDHETANLSVQKTVEEMRIEKVDHAYYCDDALNKIRIAGQKGQPYDLLISDLYFEADSTAQTIGDGFELISAVRAIQPELLILIFSAEKRPATIDKLFKNYAIDGYVRKARHDARELKMALEALSKDQRYYPQALARLVKQSNTYEFTDFDIHIIRLLSEGYRQKEMPDYLKENKISPFSLSSIEKRLKEIREDLEFTSNEQLVAFCIETGIL